MEEANDVRRSHPFGPRRRCEREREIGSRLGSILAELDRLLGRLRARARQDQSVFEAVLVEGLPRNANRGLALLVREELGLSVAVRVVTRPGADGVPVPWAAELTGQRSAALAACMAEDLGIPAERQVWHERETES